MPEGHTVHRLAATHLQMFHGRPVRATSPQGRFAAGAHRLDGQVLTGAEALGKHLLLGFGGPATDVGGAAGPGGTGAARAGGIGESALVLHVHLGIYGTWSWGTGPAPAPIGAVRLRLATAAAWYADLRGPNACGLLEPGEVKSLRDRLGPDPLRPDADPDRAYRRIVRSRTPIATLLMDQSVVAGPGNIYRAEVLFRAGVPPLLAGRDVTPALWAAIWTDLVVLMADGVRTGRIDTVRAQHTPEAMGRSPRVDDHGGEVYVYRRAGQPCLVCGTEVRTQQLAGRNLFWCPGCQSSPAVR
ncbi:Fpg/Nei family DNA glycosylase [Frankia sp. R82]|uniref:Fpg/Nei family DNA glycosylase n=1 Tax=Frankia sp. R82 TaxID=2950553 RepID=UPI002042E5A0|nr:DNA-formamidopyrimidine glycosylase family protein [Frankia sp. R82]MCM3883884.1 Fpg/Nei family DNA glycosylase [Frankia sp. R82]